MSPALSYHNIFFHHQEAFVKNVFVRSNNPSSTTHLPTSPHLLIYPPTQPPMHPSFHPLSHQLSHSLVTHTAIPCTLKYCPPHPHTQSSIHHPPISPIIHLPSNPSTYSYPNLSTQSSTQSSTPTPIHSPIQQTSMNQTSTLSHWLKSAPSPHPHW